MEGQYSFPENWALPAPSVTEEDRAPQQEEDGGSYTSAQKTFLMDGPELIDATILKVTLERMWGPEGKGYFIGFSRKEQTYFILALPSFNVDIKEIRDRVLDMQKCIVQMAESKDWASGK